jgi:hypothetical protein
MELSEKTHQPESKSPELPPDVRSADREDDFVYGQWGDDGGNNLD